MPAMNYDPNLTNSGRMAEHKVRLTFAKWEHRMVTEVTVRGGGSGLDVIKSAIYNLLELLPTELGYDDVAYLTLTDAKGETLIDLDDEEHGEDWLAKMLISAEILSIEPLKGSIPS